jgi:hypothetical protein
LVVGGSAEHVKEKHGVDDSDCETGGTPVSFLPPQSSELATRRAEIDSTFVVRRDPPGDAVVVPTSMLERHLELGALGVLLGGVVRI